MPPPRPAERQPARRTHQRQVGGQARVFEDAFLEHILEIGRIRHQKGAVKNGTVLLGFAVEQVSIPGKRVDGARILQKRQPRRKQQHAPAGAAQDRLPRKACKLARADFIPPPRRHAEEIEDEEHGLPGKKEVVVDKVQRHPERKAAFFAVQHRVVQRRQHIGKQRHNVQKVIEKDVVDAEPGECVQTARQHGPSFVLHPAACPQVSPAPGQRHFQAEQRHHGPGHELGGHEHRKPEERTAQQVERVGVDKPAA